MLIGFVFFEAMFYEVCCALSFLISFFWTMMTFGEHLKRKFYLLNDHYKLGKNNRKIQNDFHEFVSLHSEIKELSEF